MMHELSAANRASTPPPRGEPLTTSTATPPAGCWSCGDGGTDEFGGSGVLLADAGVQTSVHGTPSPVSVSSLQYAGRGLHGLPGSRTTPQVGNYSGAAMLVDWYFPGQKAKHMLAFTAQ